MDHAWPGVRAGGRQRARSTARSAPGLWRLDGDKGRARVNRALWLLALQGVLGGLDTLYYHEWRARLPARAAFAHTELRLHAGRDFIYAIMFSTLPWLAWQGWWTIGLAALFMAEIVLTLADFIVGDRVRQPLGGVYSGER